MGRHGSKIDVKKHKDGIMYKICSSCLKSKPVDAFGKTKAVKSGLKLICKDCISVNYKKWYSKNKEYHRKWRAENKEKLTLERKERRSTIEGKAKHVKNNRKSELKNPEKVSCRRKTLNEIKKGNIIIKPCMVCGNINVQVHHDDYRDAYSIMCLCSKHHTQLHNSMRDFANKNKELIRGNQI